jgi:hypothetical protein
MQLRWYTHAYMHTHVHTETFPLHRSLMPIWRDPRRFKVWAPFLSPSLCDNPGHSPSNVDHNTPRNWENPLSCTLKRKTRIQQWVPVVSNDNKFHGPWLDSMSYNYTGSYCVIFGTREDKWSCSVTANIYMLKFSLIFTRLKYDFICQTIWISKT